MGCLGTLPPNLGKKKLQHGRKDGEDTGGQQRGQFHSHMKLIGK